MKRKMIASILLAISLMTTGCVGRNFVDSKYYADESQDDYGDEEDDSEEERELTQEQIDLLCNISVNEETVREGKLKSWQEEVLNQYDSAMEYLMDKYPSYDFVITFCEPKNIVNPYTTFNFMEKSEEGVYYDMYVDVYEENGGKRYEMKDNFHQKLFEDELANLFWELMQEEFVECINVTTSLSTVQGEEYGENLDLQKILSGEMTLDHDTDFYINAEGMTDAEYTEMVEQIKEFILEKGIYGSYDVKFVNEAEPEEELYREHFFGE